jgi:transposase
VHRSPRLYDLPYSRWTLWGLRAVLSVLWDRSGKRLITLPGLHKLLKRLRIRYKRGRVALHSPDPLYNQKMAAVRAAMALSRSDPVRFPFLFEDELTYFRRPRVGRAYGGIGQRGSAARYTSGHETRMRIAGCVDSHTGAVISWQRWTLVVPEVVKYLRHVERQYPAAETIFLAWDNWPNHVHPYVSETLAALGSRIRLLPLPTYAPWTNPMEKVWLKLDQEVLDQHPYGNDWPALKQTVEQWLQQRQKGSMDLLRFIGLAPSDELPPCTD